VLKAKDMGDCWPPTACSGRRHARAVSRGHQGGHRALARVVKQANIKVTSGPRASARLPERVLRELQDEPVVRVVDRVGAVHQLDVARVDGAVAHQA